MAMGDHIFVYCAGYSHHGIDCGDGRIVHFDSGPWQKLARTVGAPIVPKVCETSWDEFAGERPVMVRRYEHSDDSQTVVARALSRVGETGYNLFGNNCKHFAVWCKTGQASSTQVDAFVEALRPVRRGFAATAMLMRGMRYAPAQVRVFVSGVALAATVGAASYRYWQRRQEQQDRCES